MPVECNICQKNFPSNSKLARHRPVCEKRAMEQAGIKRQAEGMQNYFGTKKKKEIDIPYTKLESQLSEVNEDTTVSTAGPSIHAPIPDSMTSFIYQTTSIGDVITNLSEQSTPSHYPDSAGKLSPPVTVSDSDHHDEPLNADIHSSAEDKVTLPTTDTDPEIQEMELRHKLQMSMLRKQQLQEMEILRARKMQHVDRGATLLPKISTVLPSSLSSEKESTKSLMNSIMTYDDCFETIADTNTKQCKQLKLCKKCLVYTCPNIATAYAHLLICTGEHIEFPRGFFEQVYIKCKGILKEYVCRQCGLYKNHRNRVMMHYHNCFANALDEHHPSANGVYPCLVGNCIARYPLISSLKVHMATHVDDIYTSNVLTCGDERAWIRHEHHMLYMLVDKTKLDKLPSTASDEERLKNVMKIGTSFWPPLRLKILIESGRVPHLIILEKINKRDISDNISPESLALSLEFAACSYKSMFTRFPYRSHDFTAGRSSTLGSDYESRRRVTDDMRKSILNRIREALSDPKYTSTRDFPCYYCDLQFSSSSDLGAHLSSIHGENRSLPESFASRSGLFFKCKPCVDRKIETTFTSEKACISHIYAKHNLGLFEHELIDMEENMILDGYEKTSSTIEWFYKSLRTLTTSQGKDFLKFVIHDGLIPFYGFKALRGAGEEITKFSITVSSNGSIYADKSFNKLFLPVFGSFEELNISLLNAISR